jgi:hypothetical protein
MRKPHPRLLLVEGKEDKWVIPQFMEKFIPWGERDDRRNGQPISLSLKGWNPC